MFVHCLSQAGVVPGASWGQSSSQEVPEGERQGPHLAEEETDSERLRYL